jgi:hypothetical protein
MRIGGRDNILLGDVKKKQCPHSCGFIVPALVE